MMSPSRSILLVGEGNFSFSAAMSRLYSETESSVTATCLQNQEEALRQEGASTNIQTIKDSGGMVLFEVDCTKLEECPALQGCVYDRVVFNFPHFGRKSGVKKNRQLLKNFFLSCVQVLAENGEIHVSLCNGQGGTPADQPKREWHNSWQIAAMAAEAHLILTDVHAFESEKYQSYKCTGYRSQDKGFHVENALLHVFSRSLPYSSFQMLSMEEIVDGERVQYRVPPELCDYVLRNFLSTDSVHPVKLVQDFLLEGLTEMWSVSMATESLPLLLTAKQLQGCCQDIDSAHYYWIHPLEKDPSADARTSTDSENDRPTCMGSRVCTDMQNTPSGSCVTAENVDRVISRMADTLRSACSLDIDPEGDCGSYVLRPSLSPQMEELLTMKDEWRMENAQGKNENNEGEGKKEERCKGASLCGLSGLVFRNVPISIWALPAFHQLLLRGVFPSECEPIKSLEQMLDALLGPYGVSVVTVEGGLSLSTQSMGLIGQVLASANGDSGLMSITASLNLDLLAVLLFSLPHWQLLWSHDPRFCRQFALRPSPGTLFQAFSLYPEIFAFDISFWTGPTWEEKKFHALVREASRGTVEQVQLVDTFSHPDLSQTSYCYKLFYHTHSYALSRTQALKFHKDLETYLSSRLQVTIR